MTKVTRHIAPNAKPTHLRPKTKGRAWLANWRLGASGPTKTSFLVERGFAAPILSCMAERAVRATQNSQSATMGSGRPCPRFGTGSKIAARPTSSCARTASATNLPKTATRRTKTARKSARRPNLIAAPLAYANVQAFQPIAAAARRGAAQAKSLISIPATATAAAWTAVEWTASHAIAATGARAGDTR